MRVGIDIVVQSEPEDKPMTALIDLVAKSVFLMSWLILDISLTTLNDGSRPFLCSLNK